VLQDFSLANPSTHAVHGNVGLFFRAFAFAIAAMLEGRLDQTGAKWTTPVDHLAWLFQPS